jgi:hypothetical protein
MKTKVLTFLVCAGITAMADPIPAPPSKPEPPPPMFTAPVEKTEKKEIKTGPVYDQKPLPAPGPLITVEQAKGVIDRFKEAYPKLGSPRFLIFVNRELIDTKSGISASPVSIKTERSTLKIDTSTKNPEAAAALGITNAEKITPGNYSKTTENISVNQTIKEKEKAEATLADKQTVRDIERLFGRPLRAAGATIVDQAIAVQMMDGRPIQDILKTTDSENARKDREAVRKIADVVIEILVSSKQITMPTLTGDATIAIPDIQATAIRLSDSKIIGQAASSEIISRSNKPVQNLNVYEVAEATALVLMEDMLLNLK